MWLWHSFAGGCSFACTYRFRQPRYGSELYHAGIVGPDGVTPSRGGLEYAQVAAEMKKLRETYDPKVVLPARLAARKTAILWSHDVMWDLEIHKQTALWDTWDHRFKLMAAVKSFGAPVDYIGEDDDFSRYPFLIAPAYQLVDTALIEKWRRYAEAGGHLILTCRSGRVRPLLLARILSLRPASSSGANVNTPNGLRGVSMGGLSAAPGGCHFNYYVDIIGSTFRSVF